MKTKIFAASIFLGLFSGFISSSLYAQNVGVGTNSPVSKLDVTGSLGTAIQTVSGATTLDATYSTILATPGSAYTITLPAVATSTRRVYQIVYNGTAGGNTITIKGNAAENITIGGISSNTFLLTGGSVTLQSSGSAWFITTSATTVGTVTGVSVATANGLAGTVATSTSTPAITLSTTATGMLKGNGTAISGVTGTTNGVAYWSDANTVSATAVGNTGQILQANTAAAPTWVSNNSLNWGLKGNNGITQPVTPGTYGTSTFGGSENFLGNTDGKDLVFGTSNIERMRLTSAGQLGIGTSSPGANFNVTSLGTSTMPMTINAPGETFALSSSSRYAFNPAGTVLAIAANANSVNSGALIDFNAYNSSNGANNIYLGAVAGTGANAAANFVVGRRTGATSWAESMRIDASGRLGVNNNAPTQQLDIKGVNLPPANSGTTSTAIVRIQNSTGNGNLLDIGNFNASPWGSWLQSADRSGLNTAYPISLQPIGGSVGIGNSNPQYTLDVSGDIRAGSIYRTTSGSGNILQVGDDAWIADVNAANTAGVLGSSNAAIGALQLGNNAASYIYGTGGNIGIKTTSMVQEANIGGRLYITNGVIQSGSTTAINVTSDLGLYSQTSGAWIRIASNNSPIKFFTDQGGGNSAGTTDAFAIQNSGQLTVAGGTSIMEFQRVSCNSDNCGITSFGGKNYAVANWLPMVIGFDGGSASGISLYYPFGAKWSVNGSNWQVNLDYNGTSDGGNTKTVQVAFIRREVGTIPTGSSFP
ncbi:MAG: hypothetical protein JWO03_2005 [Bacteroidetes bacterium]|nr:hypothetical protein [Bacteroidota bacterium]